MSDEARPNKRQNILFVIGLSVVGLGIMVFIFNAAQLFRTVEDMNRSYMDVRLQVLLNDVAQLTDSVRSMMSLNAALLGPDVADPTITDRLAAVTRPQFALNPLLRQIYFADLNGNFAVVSQGAGKELRTQHGRRLQNTPESVDIIDQLAMKGSPSGDELQNILVVEDRLMRDNRPGQKMPRANPYFLDPRRTDWFKRAIDSGATWSNVQWLQTYQDSGNGQLVFTLAMPVKEGDRLVGVIGADIDVLTMGRSLNKIAESYSGKVFLVDGRNALAIFPTDLDILARNPASKVRYTSELTNIELVYGFDQAINKVRRILVGDEYYQAIGARLPAETGTGWQVLLMVPESNFAGPLRNNLFLTILLIILMVSVIIYLSVFNAILIRAPGTAADALTSLMNRRSFMDETARRVLADIRGGQPTALALLDIDHFTALNSMYGSEFCDALLVDFARFLKATITELHVLGRIDSDEFGILYPACDLETAKKRCDKIRIAYDKYKNSLDDHSLLMTSFSIGVAACPENGASAGTLYTAAGKALIEAKLRGRNLNIGA